MYDSHALGGCRACGRILGPRFRMPRQDRMPPASCRNWSQTHWRSAASHHRQRSVARIPWPATRRQPSGAFCRCPAPRCGADRAAPTTASRPSPAVSHPAPSKGSFTLSLMRTKVTAWEPPLWSGEPWSRHSTREVCCRMACVHHLLGSFPGGHAPRSLLEQLTSKKEGTPNALLCNALRRPK